MAAPYDIAKALAQLQQRMASMERASQARYRSVEAGALRVYDEDGNEVLTIGRQPDDSYQIVGGNGGKVVADDVTDAVRSTLSVADGAVTAAKLAAGAVTETKIADDSVSTLKLIAGSVDTLRLAAEAVSADKLAANSVTAAKIAALAVEADKIAANAITADKIEANSITAGKLASILVLASRILAGDPDAERIELNSLGLFAFDAEGAATFSLANGVPDFLTLRNAGQTTASISQDGVISGTALNVDTITVGGEELAVSRAIGPKGILAYSNITSADAWPWPTTTSEVGLLELSFDSEVNRLYRIGTSDILLSKNSADGGSLGMRIRYTSDGSKPTVSSSILTHHYATDDYQGGYETSTLNKILSSGSALEYRLLFTLINNGTGTAAVYENTTHTFYVEDLGQRPTETGVFNNGGATTAPVKKTYTKTYNAIWSRSYDGSGDPLTSQATANQGYYSSTNGNQRSMIGFPTQIATDIAGSTINKVEVYLYFEHWYSNAGGTAVIGCHDASGTSPPGTFRGSTNLVQSSGWPKPGARWVTLPSSTHASWLSGAYRGITLGPGPSTSTTYYGKARGNGQTYEPMVRITYTK